MNKEKNIVVAGLIKGRHNLPVTEYIFDAVENVHDYSAMETVIDNFLIKEIGLVRTYGCGINQIGYEDVELCTGKKRLVVYVTGLTSVTAALIRCCAYKGVRLTLMHYDRDTDNYVEQIIF